MQVRSLGWEDLLEKEMATHYSIFAWKIPWTEFLGSQRVRHNWANTHYNHTRAKRKEILSKICLWLTICLCFLIICSSLTALVLNKYFNVALWFLHWIYIWGGYFLSEIAICILIYHNLLYINTNLILKNTVTFLQYNSISSYIVLYHIY